MLWYTAPHFELFNEDGVLEHEGPGVLDRDGVSVRKAPPFTVQMRIPAYGRDQGVCLVGVAGDVKLKGWTLLTLDEARQQFFEIKGREPTSAEVF